MVMDSFSGGVSAWVCWVFCSLRVPAQSMVHPIIQRSIAIGRNSSLIVLLRIGLTTCGLFLEVGRLSHVMRR